MKAAATSSGPGTSGSNGSNERVYLSVSPREVFKVKVRDVTFRVERGYGEWVVTAEGDPMFFKTLTEYREAIRDKFVNSITKYLKEEKKYSDITPKEVHDAFLGQFVQRVKTRKNSLVLSDRKSVFMRLPLDYNPDVHISITLTYTKRYNNDRLVYEPVVLLSNVNGEVRQADLLELLNGVEVEGTNYMIEIESYTFGDIINMDPIGAEHEQELRMLDLVKKTHGSIPRYEDVLKWLNIITGSNTDVLQLLGSYVRQKAEFAERHLWRALPTPVKKTLSLLTSVIITAPIVHYTMQVIFTSATPGSGKSYAMGVISSFLPYRIVLTNATPAALARLMDAIKVIILDDPNVNEELVKLLIQSNRKYAKKLIADKDGKGVIEIPLGGVIFMPDLGNTFDMYDRTGAARSRALIVHIAKDRRMLEIFDMYEQMNREVIELDLAGNKYSIRVDELYALDVAFFLLTADKMYHMYEELRKELKEAAERGKIEAEARYAQVLPALILLARLAGKDFEDAVWKYIKELSEELNRVIETPFDFLSLIVETILKIVEEMTNKNNEEEGNGVDEGWEKIYNELVEQTYVFTTEDGPIILARPLTIIDVGSELLRIGVHLPRVPREFLSPQSFTNFVESDPILRELVVTGKAKKSKSGKFYPHFIITVETPTIIELAKEGRVNDALRIIGCIRGRVCKELDELINEGRLVIDCSNIACSEDEGAKEAEGSGKSEGGGNANSGEERKEGLGVVEGSESSSSTEGDPAHASQSSPTEWGDGEVRREVIPRSKLREVVRELLGGDGHEPTGK